MNVIKLIELEVEKLLRDNKDGHGFDHIQRVRNLALKFALNEDVDTNIVEIACLLHDVDDYKLFGAESAENLLNANRIMGLAGVDNETKTKVIEIIKTIGFSKRLQGIEPKTKEGMIVSDADMCDAIGANGMLRTYRVSLSKGSIFFDRQTKPRTGISSIDEYKNNKSEHTAQHFFDKLLVIKSLLFTKEGRVEGDKRQQIMLDFLREIFREEESNEWIVYLDSFSNKKLSRENTHI